MTADEDHGAGNLASLVTSQHHKEMQNSGLVHLMVAGSNNSLLPGM